MLNKTFGLLCTLMIAGVLICSSTGCGDDKGKKTNTTKTEEKKTDDKLTNISCAICRFVLPRASKRNTSSSLAVSSTVCASSSDARGSEETSGRVVCGSDTGSPER